MKRVKDLFSWASVLLLAVFALASCSSSDDDVKKAEAPLMTAFGFYAEDNAGVLSKDYVGTISGTSITVSMPSSINKTALVARFTTNEGNKVLVNGVTQVSQTTKNDFTNPVDYTVSNSDGSNNARYSVTITKSSNVSWSEAAVYSASEVYAGAVLKINPTNNVPMIAFKERADESEKMTVVQLSGSSLANVGNASFSSKVSSSNYDFDISPEGTPYVAYSNSESSLLSGALSVMRYDGSAWTAVGDASVLKAQSNFVGMAALSGNRLVVNQQNNSAKADFARRVMVSSVFNGTAWENKEATKDPIYTCVTAGDGSNAYTLYINRGKVDGVNYGMNVVKYDGTAWSTLRSNYVRSGASQTSIVSYGLTVAPDGTLYIWTGDDADNTGSYGVRLERYNASTNTWTVVGGNILPLGFALSTHTSVAVAVAPDGTPYVAYRNEKDNNYPYVMYLDSETNQWSTPVRLAEAAASDVNIAFAKDGTGYVSFTDGDNHIHLMRYAEAN
ncbi:MAG: hypothetical protein SPE56_05485 [Prevotella sp.]|nr:hypothetical protein [Prevotella sp.]